MSARRVPTKSLGEPKAEIPPLQRTTETQNLTEADSFRSDPILHRCIERRKKRDFIGGADADRTRDLLNAIQALSQLSYSPTARRDPPAKRNRQVESITGRAGCLN